MKWLTLCARQSICAFTQMKAHVTPDSEFTPGFQSAELRFRSLLTSKVILGRLPTCDSIHSLWLYSAASMGIQVASTMIRKPTQSHCPDTEPTNPCPILLMPSTRLGSNKYKFYKSFSLIRPNSDVDLQHSSCVLYRIGHHTWWRDIKHNRTMSNGNLSWSSCLTIRWWRYLFLVQVTLYVQSLTLNLMA